MQSNSSELQVLTTSSNLAARVPLLRPILVVDDDAVSRHVLVHTLTTAGLSPVPVADGELALSWLEHNHPSLILLDLVMPGADGYAVLRHIRSHAKLNDVPVVVLTALDSDEEIRKIFAEGADDYVHKPFRPTELVARLSGQLRLREYVDRLSRREKNAQVAVELTQVLASSSAIRPALTVVVRRLTELLHVDRVSIVLLGNHTDVAHVVVSSDDEELHDLPIVLRDYPEISHALVSAKTLQLRDVPRHPMIADQPNACRIPFLTNTLVPIAHDKSPLGVIFVRSRDDVTLGDEELSLVRTVANATSIAFSNAKVLESLREATALSTTAREEAEQQLRHFQRYADFFESAADGMVVIDKAGTVLFTNPRTHQMTGYVDAELLGKHLDSVLKPVDTEHRHVRLSDVGRGELPTEAEYITRTKNGRPLVLSVTSSSVLHEDNATLLNLRDVTLERQTAADLKQTKEFLERVIDSSADAIISADLRGRVLLFNRSASRMLGYAPDDVIDRLNVASLYPPGVARSVLRRLVGQERGGWGRLEDYHMEVITREGQTIPVSLSAAFIVENSRPVGVVGIFTDLRERIRMEQNLLLAEHELREREKQSLIAELAGATAHELNQPLTSILGYSELLKRNMPPESPYINSANVIIGEAGRMAEIVRRIGRITRYETKAYVGEAKILDLDRSSPESVRKPRSP